MIFVFDSLHQINVHLFCVAGTFVGVYAHVSECACLGLQYSSSIVWHSGFTLV